MKMPHRYRKYPTPVNIRKMVNTRPPSDRSWTSRNPTVLRVMAAIYAESRSPQPSMDMYPAVPSIKNMTAINTVSFIFDVLSMAFFVDNFLSNNFERGQHFQASLLGYRFKPGHPAE